MKRSDPPLSSGCEEESKESKGTKRPREMPRLTKTTLIYLPATDLKTLRERNTNVVVTSDFNGILSPTTQDRDPALVLSDHTSTVDGVHAEFVQNKESKTWELKFVDEFTNKGIEQVAFLDHLLPQDWHDALCKEFDLPYWSNLCEFLLAKDRAGRYIYPPVNDIFAAFHACSVMELRAVILGQDCYHGPGQAHGLAFSVPMGVGIPSSLDNIYKELRDDLVEFKRPQHGNLRKWAEQGVMLLNTALTVTHQQPGSHSNSGWHQFTEAVLRFINDTKDHVVIFAWGAHAQNKACGLVNESKHLLLTAAHPSGLSADKGFFGCKHFSAANDFFKSHLLRPISWQL
jgi:uracil-DNA glycosylase